MINYQLHGKIAVITGAANGIGRACAERLASEGVTIALLDIDQNGNRNTATHCRKHGVTTLELACDVADPDSVDISIQQILAEFSRIDLLVNSAGIYQGSPIEQISNENWRSLLATNLDGTFHCCRAVTPALKQQGGSIINISSMAARAGFPETTQYAASKSAQIGLTRSLAMELAAHGVTVNAVCPGNTRTEMLEQVAQQVAPKLNQSPAEWLTMREQDCPLGRFAEPWEIAGIVAFLASEDARYITGQAIQVDGGMELR